MVTISNDDRVTLYRKMNIAYACFVNSMVLQVNENELNRIVEKAQETSFDTGMHESMHMCH